MFKASQVPVLRRNRATNCRASTHPFFSCNEKHCIYPIRKVSFLRGDKDEEKYDNRILLIITNGKSEKLA